MSEANIRDPSADDLPPRGPGLFVDVRTLEACERCRVFRLSGCLDASTASGLSQQVDTCTREGDVLLIFDLADLVYLSSTGIDCFTKALKSVKPRGGDIVLVAAHERVRGVLTMYGFDKAFRATNSLGNAVALLCPGASGSTAVYPLVTKCLACGVPLRLLRPMHFRCPKCSTVMTVDVRGAVLVVAGCDASREPKASPVRGAIREPGEPPTAEQSGSPARPRFPVQVFGQIELVQHLEAGGAHHTDCISIGNPRSLFGAARPDTQVPRIFRQRFQRILRLSFYDVEQKRHLRTWQFPKRIPKRSDVRRTIRFFRKTQNVSSGYTIHCWQGISRSTAFALGILYMLTKSEREAKLLLQEIRPEAGPHQKIVQWFDDELGSTLSAVNSEIRNERIARWKKELDLTPESALEELPMVSTD